MKVMSTASSEDCPRSLVPSILSTQHEEQRSLHFINMGNGRYFAEPSKLILTLLHCHASLQEASVMRQALAR